MRILYHHRTLGDGAEGIHIREMVEAFRDLGHEVRVVSIVGGGAAATESKDPGRFGSVKRLLPKLTYELVELAYNVIGKRRIAKAIAEFRPDLIYDRYNTFCTAAVNAGREAGVPVFLEVNAPMALERMAHDRGLCFQKLAVKYEVLACTMATHVFVVSTPLKSFLVNERNVPDDQISVLPNGVNLARFSGDASALRERHRELLGVSEDTIVIGFSGILRPWHGVEMLCDAVAALASEQRIHLLIVGAGPSEESIRSHLQELGLTDSSTITGRVPHDDVPGYLAAMDIAVSPRATFYASPMKIVEYLAMGVPVVAPDMPNIRDLVEKDRESLLFTPEHTDSLCDQLRILIDHPGRRRSISQAGRERVTEGLNWRFNAERVIEKGVMLTHANVDALIEPGAAVNE